MINIEMSLELLLKHVPSGDILRRDVQYNQISQDFFRKLARVYASEYTEDELDNIYLTIRDMIFEVNQRYDPFGTEAVGSKSQPLTVFGLIRLFTDRVLLLYENEVRCRYERLLDWRNLTVKISEDMFTTAFCAAMDLRARRVRDTFPWPTVIRHNNFYLEKLLMSGMSDNHFHLWASSPHFCFNWIKMMNHTDNPYIYRQVKQLNNNKLYTNVAYYQGYTETPFEVRYLQAALLRVYLYSVLSEKKIGLCEYRVMPFENWSVCLISHLLPECKNVLSQLKKDGKKVSWLSVLCRDKDKLEGNPSEETICRISRFLEQLDKLLDEPVYKPIRDNSNSESESEHDCCLDCVKQLLDTDKSIRLSFFEPILCPVYYGELWRKCTKETVAWWLQSDEELLLHEDDIQDAIRVIKWENDLDEETDYIYASADDRMLSANFEETCLHTCNSGADYESVKTRSETQHLLWGERYFLYHMFRMAYTDRSQNGDLLNWFYAYLTIKEEMRSEFIQSNDRIGFRNFQNYDRRKGWLWEGPYDERKILKLAIKDTLSSPNLENLEIRIVPADTAEQDREYIELLDGIYENEEPLEAELEGGRGSKDEKCCNSESRAIDGRTGGKCEKAADCQGCCSSHTDGKDRYYFVFHFIKAPDNDPEIRDVYACRHYQKRQQVMRQATAIADLRYRYPKEGKRVYGIDACSSEIGCRPEVFAQAFRFLKGHCVIDKGYEDPQLRLPQLRATYHVGEDFLDLVDGLRAIDEAVFFLQLGCGDRLGHALALGIDVRKYYDRKHRIIHIAKQDYLDNLAWMYHRLGESRQSSPLSDLRNHIEREFAKYFSEVYADCYQAHNYNIRTYYDAWKLRGDDPECYRTGKYESKYKTSITYWDQYSYDSYSIIEDFEKLSGIRKIDAVTNLYSEYHFNNQVRQKGNEREEVHIPEPWVEGVILLQKIMQDRIAKKGIAIESNPSSNYMIMGLNSYQEHPIVYWYNRYLEEDTEKLRECPQLSVSINTDDQGDFSTTLENEYALMACALEQAKDKDGIRKYKRNNIYEWLDQVRKMGNLQSFRGPVSGRV